MKQTTIIALVAVVAAVAVIAIVGAYIGFDIGFEKAVTSLDEEMPTEVAGSFEECAALGYPVMTSYPPQCTDSAGNHFVEDIGNELSKMDFIRIEAPRPNAVIASPLRISGEARGTWFFEASLPVVLTDWDGKIIGEGYVTAVDDWMTEEFVSFEGELIFETGLAGGQEFMKRGTLILQKDNPSGLPENDDALEIPVRFE